MSIILFTVLLAILSFIAGYFTGWLYFSKQRRYLLFTVNAAGASQLDAYYQAKVAETIRLWKTGKYYKILILSNDERYESGSFSTHSLTDTIHAELLEAGISVDQIQCHHGTIDLPHYVVEFDYATGEL